MFTLSGANTPDRGPTSAAAAIGAPLRFALTFASERAMTINSPFGALVMLELST